MIIVIPYFLIRPNFIKKSITALEKNILTLSEEQINTHLKEIYKLTQTEFFEIAVLNEFLKRIQKKKTLFYQKQYALYNWSMLPWTILTFSWYNPKYQEYKEYYKKFSFIEKKLEQKIKNLHKKNLKIHSTYDSKS
jgi:hypothetical protein